MTALGYVETGQENVSKLHDEIQIVDGTRNPPKIYLGTPTRLKGCVAWGRINPHVSMPQLRRAWLEAALTGFSV